VVVATNVSPVGVAFENVTVSGSPFSITSNQCKGTLAPLRLCAVTVQFSPKQTGQFKGKLTFTDTAVGDPQTVPLYGTATKDHD